MNLRRWDWKEDRICEPTHTWVIKPGFARYFAKLEIIIDSGSSLPPIRLDYCLDFLGASLGWTCTAWTRRGLEKKMAKITKEAIA